MASLSEIAEALRQEVRQDLESLQAALGAARQEFFTRLKETTQNLLGLEGRIEEGDRKLQKLDDRLDKLSKDSATARQALDELLKRVSNLQTGIEKVDHKQEETHAQITAIQETQTVAQAATAEVDNRLGAQIEGLSKALRELISENRRTTEGRLAEIRVRLQATIEQAKKRWHVTLGFLLFTLLLIAVALFRPEIASWFGLPVR